MTQPSDPQARARGGRSARRRAREFALQGLYQWLVGGHDLAAVEGNLMEHEGFREFESGTDVAHFRELLHGSIEGADELRAHFARFIDRDVKDLSPVEHAILLIGTGGVLVELAGDTALRLLPLAAGDIAAMVDGLALAKLVAGFRGRPPLDRGALEAAALALGRFFLDHRARLTDVEINPLMVRAEGAVAVDVRAVWREDGS